MAFLCPSRVGQGISKAKKKDKPFIGFPGRITGSDSVDTLVRVGLEKEHGLPPSSYTTVLHDFLPTADNEVTVRQGEGVYILYVETEWVYVIKKNGLEGFVPLTYISQSSSQESKESSSIGKNKRIAGETNSFLEGYSNFSKNGSTIQSTPRKAKTSPPSNGNTTAQTDNCTKNGDNGNSTASVSPHVMPGVQLFRKTSHGRFIVLFDFNALDENDVTVERAELVQVLNIEDPDWSWIKKYNRQEGFVPKSYICPVGPLKAQERLNRSKRKQQESPAPHVSSSPKSKTKVPTDKMSSPEDHQHPKTHKPKMTSPQDSSKNQTSHRPKDKNCVHTNANVSPGRTHSSINSLNSSMNSKPYQNDLSKPPPYRPSPIAFPNLSDSQINSLLKQFNQKNKLPSNITNDCANLDTPSKESLGDAYIEDEMNCSKDIQQSQKVYLQQRTEEASNLWTNGSSSKRLSDSTENIGELDGSQSLSESFESQMEEQMSITDFNLKSMRRSEILNRVTAKDSLENSDSSRSVLPLSTEPALVGSNHLPTYSSIMSGKQTKQLESIQGKLQTQHHRVSSSNDKSHERVPQYSILSDFKREPPNINSLSKTAPNHNMESNQRNVPTYSPIPNKQPESQNGFNPQCEDTIGCLNDSVESDTLTEVELLYDFRARSIDDLSVSQGEKIFTDLLTNCNEDWIWAYSPKTQKYGFVPKSYLGTPEQTIL